MKTATFIGELKIFFYKSWIKGSGRDEKNWLKNIMMMPTVEMNESISARQERYYKKSL